MANGITIEQMQQYYDIGYVGDQNAIEAIESYIQRNHRDGTFTGSEKSALLAALEAGSEDKQEGRASRVSERDFFQDIADDYGATVVRYSSAAEQRRADISSDIVLASADTEVEVPAVPNQTGNVHTV